MKNIKLILKDFYIIELFNTILIKIFPKKNDFILKLKQKHSNLIKKTRKQEFEEITLELNTKVSELCLLGEKFKTDKSPLNPKLDHYSHRHAYTFFYDLIFKKYINAKINFAELGIWKNASTKLWRTFFKKAHIYMFDFFDHLIIRAKKDKLRQTKYIKIDVSNYKNLNSTFKNLNKKFDIIIDDSSHIFEHQILIINSLTKFLKPDSFLIIEDIHSNKKRYENKNYFKNIKVKSKFKEIYFVNFKHKNLFTGFYKNNKILVMRTF